MIRDFFRREIEDYSVLFRKIPPVGFSIFVLSVVVMNLLANKELFHTEWIALDCGFLFSWIPMLYMDCCCKVFGGKSAVKLSVFALFVNLVVFLLFKLIMLTPGMWGEYYVTGIEDVNTSISATIGGSTWIVLGSAFAMFVSSIVNSISNIGIAKKLKNNSFKHFALRSYISTAVAQYVDNFVFATVVSIPLFGWTLKQTLICSLTGMVVELLSEILFSGVGYKLCKYWEIR